MANVFDSFVKAYDQTVGTDDRIKRGQYADYADWLRLNNTFSNDEVSRNYNRLISDRFGQLTPSTVNGANRIDALGQAEFPARLAVTNDTSNAIMANTRPFVDANMFSAQANASTAQNNAALAEQNRLFNLTNPDASQGPAIRAQNFAQNQTELRALSGNSPDELARVFGGTRDDYIRTPQGWVTKDGRPILTSEDKRLYQFTRPGYDPLRASVAGVQSPYGPGPWADPMSEPGGHSTPSAAAPGLGVFYPPEAAYKGQQAERFVRNPGAAVVPSGQVGPYGYRIPFQPGSNGIVRRPDAYNNTERVADVFGAINGAMSTPGLLSGIGRDDNITKDYVPDKDQELIKEYGALSIGEQVKLGTDAYAKYNAAKRRVAQFNYFKEANMDNTRISEERRVEALRRAEFERRYLSK